MAQIAAFALKSGKKCAASCAAPATAARSLGADWCRIVGLVVGWWPGSARGGGGQGRGGKQRVSDAGTKTDSGSDAVAVALALLSREEPDACLQRLAQLLGLLPGLCYIVVRGLGFVASMGAGLAVLQLAPSRLVGINLLDLWGTRVPDYEPHAWHRRALEGLAQTYQEVW